MKKLALLFFAVAVAVAGLVAAPPPAEAFPWCMACADTGDCFACCRCEGGTNGDCKQLCH